MQNAIPAAPELPVVSLSPEVRVLVGQNQIRRLVSVFAENYQGADVRTSNRRLASLEEVTISEPILALVMDASAPIEFTFAFGNAGEPTTVTTKNKLLVWDQRIESATFRNTTLETVQMQLIYAVPLPVV